MITWLLLLLALAFEAGAALLHCGWLAWGLAPVMVGSVAFRFMHVGQGSPLSRIFAITGLFWLAILLGLGSIDFMVRRDVPAPVLTR